MKLKVDLRISMILNYIGNNQMNHEIINDLLRIETIFAFTRTTNSDCLTAVSNSYNQVIGLRNHSQNAKYCDL